MRYTWTNTNDPDIESPRCAECMECIDVGETAIVTCECKRNYKAEAFMHDKRMIWTFIQQEYIHYPSCVRDRDAQRSTYDADAGLPEMRSEDASDTGTEEVGMS